MIQNGFSFIAFIIFFAAMVLLITKKYPSKVYQFLPPVIIIYLSIMLMYTLGVWEMTESVSTTRSAFINHLVPTMIFLMCLNCDFRRIIKLGFRLIFTFFAASFAVCLGFIISFAIFNQFMPEGTHLAYASMSAGWMGGTQNFLAIKSALNVSDELMTNTLLMGNIFYSIIIMMLVAGKSYMPKFNKWTKTDYSPIAKIAETLALDEKETKKIDFLDIFVVLGIGLFASALATYFSGTLATALTAMLPAGSYVDAGILKILLATFAGIGCALTPMGKLRGLNEVSTICLYLILILTATNVNLKALIDAPIYILAGTVIVAVIFLVVALLAKLFKFDLYTCGIAIIANVGGVASAPIIAASYSQSLVGIAVLMALLGDVAGTFLAFGVLEMLTLFV